MEDDVVADGALHELSVLHAGADAVVPQAAQVDAADVVLVVEDGARERFLQSHHQSHQCALTAARRADQCHVVAAVDGQVEAVEEHGHVVGIAELQPPYAHLAGDGLYHIGALPDFRLGLDDGSAELEFRQQARDYLNDTLQLKYGSADDAQHGAISDIVGERQPIVPGRPHRHNHGQELQAIADAVHVEADQRLAAAVHLRRCIRLCPLVEGTELCSAGLDFLYA